MKKFQLTAGILAAACLVLIGIFTLVQNSLGGRLDSQEVCSRWAGDGTRYAQLSAFISPTAGLDEDSVKYSLTSGLDSAYVEASIKSNEGARLYAYSYSGETKVSVSMLNPETGLTAKSGVTATAMGVGADFFIFHPLKLLSGNYIDTYDSVLNDTIIIDNDLAWQFFGSPDVVGRQLQINGKTCYISGVCEVDPDYAEFYGDNPRIYMSYSLLADQSGDLSITCVETCMPDPVKNFAAGILEKSIGVQEQYIEIVENSARFTDRGLFERLRDFPKRSVRTKLVAYPYWENTAVILVDRAALLYVGKLIPLAVIVLLAAAELIIAYRKRKVFYRFAAEHISSAWDKLGQERRRRAKKRLELNEAKKKALPDKKAPQILSVPQKAPEEKSEENKDERD